MQKRILAVVVLLVVAGCQAPEPAMPPLPPPAPKPAPVVPRPAQQPALPPVHSAGPLTKADVETYMNAQEADLRSYLRGQDVLVSRRGDTLVVILQSDRLFNKNGISNWGDAFLRAVYQVVGHFDRTMIAVNGYSNSAGSADKAVAASEERAKAVADGLIRYGIAAGRLSVNGLGATNLRIPNAADPRNRRIEIKIAPDPK